RRNLTALPGVHSPEAAQPSQKWARYGPPETGSERVQKLEHVPVGAAVEDCPFFERFPAAPCAIPRGEPDVWPEAPVRLRARSGGAPMETGNRFSRCLLDQKDEEARRARRLRRRTLLLAILIQAILLTLLCLRPLFGAQELRLMARLVPLAPWKGQPGAHHPAPAPHPAAPHHLLYPNLLPPDFVFPRAHPAEQLQTDDAPDVGPISDLPSGGGFGDPNGLVPIPGL